VYAGKVVAKSSLKKTKAQQKLVAEIKIHQHLHNPNVVRFYRSFQDKHNVYILLELCSNQSLMELMKKRKRLTEPEVRFYFLQILEAVQYLHRNNVIHRDLKLGNLFLNKDLQVKLGDMGLSTKLENADERKKTICGTPNYIAPEVISGGTHSFEVDVWSLGVILFTMLVGKPPFETRDVKATYKRIKRGQFNFPESVQLSRDARLLIESLLQLVPEKRPTVPQIRSHSFFTRPGAFTPRSLPVSALTSVPNFATPVPRAVSSGDRVAGATGATGGAVSAAGGAIFQTLKPSSKTKISSSSKSGGRASASPLIRPPSKLQLLVKGTQDSPRNFVINSKKNNAKHQHGGGRHHTEFRDSVDNASTPVEPRVPSSRRGASSAAAAAATAVTTTGAVATATSVLSRPSSAAGVGVRQRGGGALREDTTQRPQTARAIFSSGDTAHGDKKLSSRHRHADRLAALNQRLGRMELRAFSGNANTHRAAVSNHNNTNSAGGDPPSSGSSSSTHGATAERSENSAPSTVVSAVSSTSSSLSSLPEGSSGSNRHHRHVSAAAVAQTLSSSSSVVPKLSTLKAMHRELSRSLLDGGMEEAEQRVAGVHASSGKHEATRGRHSTTARYGSMHSKNAAADASSTDSQRCAVSEAATSAANGYHTLVVPPKVWVVRHVDYTRKYGFGYLLSNGAVGVYFNDSTKIILSANNRDFEYIERMRSTSTLTHPPRHAHTLENYPDSLKKKVTLLVHFKAHLCGAEKKHAAANSAGGSDGGMAVAGSGGGDAAAPAAADSGEDRDATGGMTYVKKWVRTNRCLLFRLSDRSVQVAFFDNTEVILSQAGGSLLDLNDEHHGSIALTYVDKDKTRTSYSLQGVMESSKAHILKRLRYTKSVIHELLSGKLSNPRGGSKKPSSQSGGEKVKR
jgi:serine/threonine protein kinase